VETKREGNVDSEMGSRDVLGMRAETGKEVGFARVREY
jgi:hypothetical protein